MKDRYHRWQRNGLAAIPEDMDALQSNMRGTDMNIAMLLTWNYMATKFNEQLDSIQKDADRLQEKLDIACKKNWKLQDKLKELAEE